MFGTQHTLKQLFGGIAIAAFLAVVAVPSAFAGSFITDTLGGNGYPKATPDVFERAVARHEASQVRAQQARSQAQGMRFITDTLGGNGYPATKPSGYNPGAYVNGSATPAVAQAIQDLGNGVTPSAPSVTGGSSGTSFNWSDAGIGAGFAAGLLLLLAWGARLRTHNRRGVLTV